MEDNGTQSETPEKNSFVFPMRPIDAGSAAAAGAVAGIVAWVIFFGISQIDSTTLLCGNQTSAVCQSAPRIIETIALIGGSIFGLLGLIRFRVFRPLLVVLAALVSLGGMQGIIAALPWYIAAVLSIALFAVAYAVYAWLSRMRSFILSVVAIVIVAVVVRLVLFS